MNEQLTFRDATALRRAQLLEMLKSQGEMTEVKSMAVDYVMIAEGLLAKNGMFMSSEVFHTGAFDEERKVLNGAVASKGISLMNIKELARAGNASSNNLNPIFVAADTPVGWLHSLASKAYQRYNACTFSVGPPQAFLDARWRKS